MSNTSHNYSAGVIDRDKERDQNSYHSHFQQRQSYSNSTFTSMNSHTNTGVTEDSDDEKITNFPKLSNFGSALLLSEKEIFTKNNNSTHQDDHSRVHTNPSILVNTYDYDQSNNSNSITFQKFKEMQQSIKEEVTTKQNERRKTRRFFDRTKTGILGPAKRANLDHENSDINDSHDIEKTDDKITKTNLLSSVPTSILSLNSSSSSSFSYHESAAVNNSQTTTHSNIDYNSIEFGDLNPVQYIKKFKLPATELAIISKIYFEKQKLENRKIALKKHSSSKEFFFSSSLSSKSTSASFPTTINNNNENNITPSHISQNNILNRPQPNDFGNDNLENYYPNKKREALSSLDININKNKFNVNNNGIKKSKMYASEVENERRPLSVREFEPNSIHYENFQQEKRTYQKPTKKVEIIEPKPSLLQSKSLTRNLLSVNEVEYEKIELLGRGGSSKVYKVKNVNNNKIYALKRVMFDEFDDSSVNGFKGEIELLKKLEHEKRVVKLVQYQMENGVLFLIMECGDHDLSQILNQRINMRLDIEFIRYYAREMLKCVKVVHDAGIVHSDLKPANFVLVKGILKIIDFGIANAVPDHTVNIYRETQIGTPNYMAPEALVAMNNQSESDNQNKWKVGKPSDIWSCGCIIYQMIYGRPPYGSFQGQNRLLAIMNPEVKIVFSEKTSNNERIPRSALEIMKACLMRNPNKRWSVDKVLSGPFINPVMVTPFIITDLIKNAVNYGVDQRHVSDEKISELADDVLKRLADFRL